MSKEHDCAFPIFSLILFRSHHEQQSVIISYKRWKCEKNINHGLCKFSSTFYCCQSFINLGLIKTKRRKFSSSQLILLTSFKTDLSFGGVQIPSKVYLSSISRDPTYFKVQLVEFSTPFPVCTLSNILCILLINCYITVVHDKFHERLLTNKWKSFSFFWVLVVSYGLSLMHYFKEDVRW